MLDFDWFQIMTSSVVSALILFMIGFSLRWRFCFDASEVKYSKSLRAVENMILFIEILLVFLVPFLLFYLKYEGIPLWFTLTQLPEYVIGQLAALLGLLMGDEIGSILNRASRRKLDDEPIPSD